MDANEKVLLRDFLSKCPNFLKELKESAPKCEGKTMEERAVTGSERQGWQNAVDHIEILAKPDNQEVEAQPFITG